MLRITAYRYTVFALETVVIIPFLIIVLGREATGYVSVKVLFLPC